MTLEQLRILVRVVQMGSFTRAADALDLQKSHVSRVIAQLEAELGVKLMERTTRTLSVTETGREVFERALGILTAVEDTLRITQDAQGEPQGVLRLTCSMEFALLAANDWVQAYLARYPAVSVEAEHTSRVLDLVHEGFDLALRVGPLEESRLVARSLGQLSYGLFATPAYLRGRSLQAPEDLRQHALLAFSGGSERRAWRLVRRSDAAEVRVEGHCRLRANSRFAVRDALLAHLGIGQLPWLMARSLVEQGALVQVLPEWQPPAVPIHGIYPSNRYLSPKVRAFIDVALQRLPATPTPPPAQPPSPAGPSQPAAKPKRSRS